MAVSQHIEPLDAHLRLSRGREKTNLTRECKGSVWNAALRTGREREGEREREEEEEQRSTSKDKEGRKLCLLQSVAAPQFVSTVWPAGILPGLHLTNRIEGISHLWITNFWIKCTESGFIDQWRFFGCDMG